MHPDRLHPLKKEPLNPRGEYVLYWMNVDQRVEDNPALTWALSKANEKNLPMVVGFNLWEKYPSANLRHFHFMLEGLKEVALKLQHRGIRFVMVQAPMPQGIVRLAKLARLVVCDRGYLPMQRAWRKTVAEQAPCPVVEVEGHVVVPVETAYPREAYSAAVLRPSIGRLLDLFLHDEDELPPPRSAMVTRNFADVLEDFAELDATKGTALLSQLALDTTVGPVGFEAGYDAAWKGFQHWLDRHLEHYDTGRNDPNQEAQSNMSPYLHFGQISARRLAKAALERGGEGAKAFVEELVVRRELSMNFVWYNPRFDQFDALPAWCLKTLASHRQDPREYVYTLEEWEKAQTHDPAWNACQRQMVVSGKMHGYMRMYWGKKLIEWSATPEQAWKWAIYLNDKYELDGRDPNGYAGVAWCFGKHDRPWTERAVFGTLRYMNFNGLKRKFDIERYILDQNRR
jgi:deoxyribodipyrimidine photo-lyase